MKPLISQPFISCQQVDDTTISEAVLQNVVLHNLVVMMGIYADVLVMREAEVHDVVEYAMNIWIAGYSMYNMIRLCVIKPFTIIDFAICWFW